MCSSADCTWVPRACARTVPLGDPRRGVQRGTTGPFGDRTQAMSLRVPLGVLACAVLASVSVSKAHAQGSLRAGDLRAGDIVFQDSGSRQGRVIREVTASPWSHVGVVLPHDGSLHVLEAISPVSWTPLADWMHRARGDVLVRRLPRPLRVAEVERLVEVGARMVGRPYDARFEWGETRLYCSELVFLLFERALDMRVVEPQRWRDLDLGPRGRALARRRLGRQPRADGRLVTPSALALADSLTTVDTTGAPTTSTPPLPR